MNSAAEWWLRLGGVVGLGSIIFLAGLIAGSDSTDTLRAKQCDKMGQMLLDDSAYECRRK